MKKYETPVKSNTPTAYKPRQGALSKRMRLAMGFLRFLEPIPKEYRAAEDDEG
jgi:hypothetical protein